jgi:outer membrane protein OmpA-like peptidoglycan-associated protein
MKGQQIAVAIGMILAGCSGSLPRLDPSNATSSARVPAGPPASPPSAALSGYTYDLLRPGETQLLQVFDDTRRTYLRFEGQVPLGLLIFDERGRALPFTVREHTAIVDVVHEGLLVRTPTKMSYAQAPHRGVAVQVAATGEGEGGAPALPAELAAARAEILRAEERLSGVSAALDQASRGETSASSLAQLRSEIEEIQTTIDGVTATLARAHFASGSAVLALSSEAKRALLAAARRADEIRIQGGTDSSGSAAVNDRLAQERARSMRRLLIDGGVAAEKLRTSHAPADYVASNSTVAGRAQNRRVDVVFADRATPAAQNRLDSERSAEASVAAQ